MSEGLDEADSGPPPEIYVGELDGALFEDYLADLAELASVRAIRVDDGTGGPSEPNLDLEMTRMLLLSGRVRRVQIRYEHDGVAWIDTLAHGAQGLRLVRARDPRVAAPAEPPKHRLRVLS